MTTPTPRTPYPTPCRLTCIVIGNPIAHSKSPELHAAFARQTGIDLSYQRLLCPNTNDSFVAVVEAFFAGSRDLDPQAGNIRGANVTVPFKTMAFALCQTVGELSDYAQAAGAVNTLAIKNGKLYGDNTDGRGLVTDLQAQLQKQNRTLQGSKVAILGAGGATRGAILPLLQAGATLTIFNRTLEKATSLVAEFSTLPPSLLTNATTQPLIAKPLNTKNLVGDFAVIINATASSLSGEQLPFSSELTASFAYDMMYGKPSQFLDFFEQQGGETADGLGMLMGQGALSFELWTGKKVDLAKLGNPFD